jgi:hypothetical protein
MRVALLALDAGWRFLLFSAALKIINLEKLVSRVQSISWLRYRLSKTERAIVSRWIAALSVRCSHNPCLLHALVLFSLDRNATFFLGVAKDEAFHSHAWIESEGIVYSTVASVEVYQPIWRCTPYVS